MTALFDKMAFVGAGLIGSSLLRVVKEKGLAKEISVASRRAETCAKVKNLGLADEVTQNPAIAVKDADCVMICTPMGAYRSVMAQIAPSLKKGAILSDVGSVKGAAIKDVADFLPDGVSFVPGHPLAGTEHSGPDAGFAELFLGRWCILTPDEKALPGSLDKIRLMWEQAGMMVEEMDPEHHDKVLGITSHLPHLIAYSIVGTASDLETHLMHEVIKFSASGFRDFTRIAASDPVMWRDIFLTNKEAVLEILQRFTEDLTALQRAIRWDEGETLEKLFTRTRTIRRGVIDARQDTPEEMKRLLSQEKKES